MSELVAYPTSPVEAVGEVIRIIREGTIVADRSRFGLCLWNAIGFVQSITLGDGQPLVVGAPGTAELADLETQLTAVLDNSTVAKADPAQLGFLDFLAFIKALLDLLRKLRQ